MVRTRTPPARLFAKVAIVGVGLMGGSLGLAVKKRGLAREVAGLVRRRPVGTRAKALGAVDTATLSPEQALAGADLVVFCTPASSVPGLLQEYLPFIAPGCLVTDVSSTKVRFLQDIEKLLYQPDLVRKTPPPEVPFAFVSSHPMAGSEKEGVEHARKDLYDGSHCFLIRTKHAPAEAIARLEGFWRAVGCRRLSVVTPEEHDRWVAAVSHLPHALAACLVNVLADLAAKDPRIAGAAGPGFRDTTRVAGSSAALWEDILMHNREEVSAMIDLLRHQLSRLETALRSGEGRRLRDLLERASRFRQEMEIKKRAAKKS